MRALSLSSPWLTAVLALVATALVLRAAPRLRGGPRLRVLALTVVLLAMGSYANSYFSYFPRVGDLVGPRPWPVASAQAVLSATAVDHAGRFPAGAVVTLRLEGVHSRTPAQDALVYLPPQYFDQPTRRFPVLYLLHGSPGVPLDWFRGGDAARAGLDAARVGEPVVLVAPRMSQGWLQDSECLDRGSFRAESYLTTDVVPNIDGLLRTDPRPEARGLLGNSAGGYCALDLALRHPDKFGAAIGLSPLTSPTYSYGSLGDLFGHPAGLQTLVNEHTPRWLLQHRPAARSVRLRLDVGRADSLSRGPTERFAAQAQALSDEAPLLVEWPGAHTFRVWRPALSQAVQWFANDSRPA